MTTRKRNFVSTLTCFFFVLTSGDMAGAQVQGPKQTERLAKRVVKTSDAIMATKNQIRSTLDIYNQLLSQNVENRRRVYKKLQREIRKSDKRVEAVETRATEMNAEANLYFADWGRNVEAISSEDLRARGQARLDDNKARFAAVLEKGRSAGADYQTFMTSLRDQVLYLGHDLNPAGVGSTQEDARKINQKADVLFEKIDMTIMAFRAYVADLQPE